MDEDADRVQNFQIGCRARDGAENGAQLVI
jgi:hypothetical protein